MLRIIREKMAFVMLLTIILFIGTIIFSWGMGGIKSSNPRQKNIIAKINGEEIKYSVFERIEQNLTQKEKSNDPDEVRMAELRNEAWDSMVQEVLINQAVANNGIVVSKEKLIYEIRTNPLPQFKQNPAFITNGKFDLKKYQDFIDHPKSEYERDYRMIENIYANWLPKLILNDRLESAAVVSNQDIMDEYEKNNIKAEAKYFKVPSKNFQPADSLISDAEIKKYYDEHIGEYPKMEEKRGYEYILFSTEATKKDSALSLEDINYVNDQLKKGMDFGEAAKTYSEDKGSAEKNGDLGYFKRGQMVPAFENAAFDGKIGSVVGPIKSKFGYHLIKIEDKKIEKGVVVEVKASHILYKFKAYQSTKDDAKYKAQNFRDEFYEKKGTSGAFEALAKSNNKKIVKADLKTKNDYSKELGRVPGFGDFLFNNPTGTVSKMLISAKGYVFIKIGKIEPKRIKTVEELKRTIVYKIKNEKGLEVSFKELSKLASSLKDTASFSKTAKSYGFVSGYTGSFGKSYIKGIGADKKFSEVAFSLEPGTISKTFKGKTGSYIIFLIKKNIFDKKDFAKKENGIKTKLLTALKNDITNSWFKNLKNDAEIEDYRSYYFR